LGYRKDNDYNKVRHFQKIITGGSTRNPSQPLVFGIVGFEFSAQRRRRGEFPLGQTVATPGALEVLTATGTSPTELLTRHQRGDWGDVPPEDAEENELSVREGFRILSSYKVGDDKLWVITEADRSVTTILKPGEY